MSETRLQIDCPKCGEPVFVSEFYKSQAAELADMRANAKLHAMINDARAEEYKRQAAEIDRLREQIAKQDKLIHDLLIRRTHVG